MSRIEINRRTFNLMMTGLMASGLSRPALAEKPKPVRIAYGVTGVDPSTAPWLSAANTGGFWQEEGLDVHVTGFNGAGPALQLLAHGQVDVVFAGTPDMMRLREQGTKIITVANAYNSNHIYPVVLESSQIKSLKDFPGKRLGIQTMTGSIYLWTKVLLQANGLKMEDLANVIPVGTGAPAVHALQSGQIDILSEWHGHYALLETQFGMKLRKFNNDSSLKQNSFVQAFFVREETIKNDPQMLLGLLRGITMGLVFTRENPEAVARGHFEQHPQTRPTNVSLDEAVMRAGKVIAENVQLSLTTLADREWGYAAPQQVERVRDVLIDADILQQKLAWDRYYTPQFIKGMNDFDVDEVIKRAKAA
jgi:ABC-type nitrate/sulfonate/bicarbonate transport system substrate-binding protein